MKNKTFERGILNLKDLKVIKNKQSEQFYFGLQEKYKKRMFDCAINISGSIRDISNILNVNYFNLWDSIKRSPISLSLLQKVSSFLVKSGFEQFSLEIIQKNIQFLKGGFTSDRIEHPNFPINFRTIPAMNVVSHLYHDGGIGFINRQPLYRNKSFEECNNFLDDAKLVFGSFNRKVVSCKDGTFTVHLPTVIGDLLILMGFVAGDKTKNNADVLPFLYHITEKDLLSTFLAKAFNDDGFVGKRSVSLAQASLIKTNLKKPSNVLLLDKLFLERLGLNVAGPTLAKTYPNRFGICTLYSISIYSKEQLRYFNKHVNLIDYKKRKLENFLNNGYKCKDNLYK